VDWTASQNVRSGPYIHEYHQTSLITLLINICTNNILILILVLEPVTKGRDSKKNGNVKKGECTG
jgi:hypothetical protein